MGCLASKPIISPPSPPPPPRFPNVQLRVLIIGRANAGKTSILQKVCDTTESPGIYRPGPGGTRHRVSAHSQWRFRSHAYLMAYPGYTRPHNRGLTAILLSETTDHGDPADSVAITTSRMNSSSRITLDTFSTTPADLRRAVQTS